jgi:hypothetical protein
MEPQNKIAIFSKKGQAILIKFQQFMEISSLNNTVRALRAQTRNFDFIEICFSGQTDLNVVRYSVISDSLPTNNQFRFQGNVVRVIRI